MRRLLLLAGAASAMGVLVFLLIQQADYKAERVATPPPATDSVKPSMPLPIDRVETVSQRQASKDRPPRDAPPSFQSDLVSALGSERSDLLSLFEKGTRAGASAGEQYVAYQIVGACLSSILRMQHARFPEVSGDTIKEVDDARARLAQRCSVLERIGTDQILRDYKALGAAAVAEGSFLNSGLPSFSRARNEAERKAVADRLAQTFSEYGPIALQWASGSFSDYLRLGTTPFARQVREMSSDKDTLHYATSLALCKGSDICGGGLLYLVVCSETAKCGGNYLNSLLSQVSAEEDRVAQPIAKKIAEAINTGEWAAP